MSRHKVLTLWNEEQLNEEETRILRTPCGETPVPFDAATTKAIRALRDSFLEWEDAAGLAAPQIGISRRIIAFRSRNFDDKDPATRKEDYEILINPRITQKRGEPVVAEEVFLYCTDILVEISRYPEIKVRAYDLE